MSQKVPLNPETYAVPPLKLTKGTWQVEMPRVRGAGVELEVKLVLLNVDGVPV